MLVPLALSHSTVKPNQSRLKQLGGVKLKHTTLCVIGQVVFMIYLFVLCTGVCQTVCHRTGCMTYLFVLRTGVCVCQTVCHRTGCMTYLFVLCTGVCVCVKLCVIGRVV